jgi:hypothetical protein
MCEKSTGHEGSISTIGKVLATIYAAAFAAIVGISVHHQLKRIMPSEPDGTFLAAKEVAIP